MHEYNEYVKIILHKDTDLYELENHLSMNGYDFGIDKVRRLLLASLDELAYVETILEDRNIKYCVC